MVVSLASNRRFEKSFVKLAETVEIPDLIRVQIDSFQWLQEEGLKKLFEEISPIRDHIGSRLELKFGEYEFGAPQRSVAECFEQGVTYSAPLFVSVQLVIKESGEIKEERLFFGDFPLMTENGTFIISGVERVGVSQVTRFPGVYFTLEKDPVKGRDLGMAKLVAERGAWLEFETSSRDVISVKMGGKRKMPATTLLRAIGYESDEELISLFEDVDNSPEHAYIRSTIEREPSIRSMKDALIDIYRKLSSGEPPSLESAKTLLNNFLFNPRRYSFGEVGRYKLNKKLGVNVADNYFGLMPDDLVQVVRHVISINNGQESPDDIDHLDNRRVHTVGSLIQDQFRVGLLRLEKAIKERMSILGAEVATPSTLVNIRPVVAAIKEFFNRSQLSQFLDQTNPLSELTHKRRVSAMGPGGLSRERAGFEVRDVHHSHYGRLCPIETPEGPNIGLIASLSTYAKVDKYGFVQTPYLKVIHEVPRLESELMGRTIKNDVLDDKGGIVAAAGTLITKELANQLSSSTGPTIGVVPFVSFQSEYLTADEEDQHAIAQADISLNGKREFVNNKVEVKMGSRYFEESVDRVDFMDVSPRQLFSVSACLIPFLEHNDANRALMGCNMERQGVPLLRPHAPLVATGMEKQIAKYSGQVIFTPISGVVSSVTGSQIKIKDDEGEEHVLKLTKFVRTNQGTCVDQVPVVNKGDKLEKGQVIANSSSIENGELALGQNAVCAFMSWEGYNYEDAIILSKRLVKDDVYTSIHIEKYEIEARVTKLGPEEITRDIPSVNEESLRDLDEHGIIRIGAEVGRGDILVGKITPKGETELSAEEKLLRAIFGEKTREVKDNSLRLPPGEWGRVIDVKVFSRDKKHELPAGVNELVRVWVAQKRKISVGDKMSGRHGNKGVVSIIVPEEDMPFLPDGTPVDIVLNPLGVPSRMNIGQVMEAHMGWTGYVLGFKALTPVFSGADSLDIEDNLCRAWIAWEADAVTLSSDNSVAPDWEKIKVWLSEREFDFDEIMNDKLKGRAKRAALCLWLKELGVEFGQLTNKELEEKVDQVYKERRIYPPTFGKINLCDGKTGEHFDQPVTVGNVYIMKLIHLVEDKVHARSTGPYSLITQQPLGGKAQFGGQRFGEMEVWALEGYGAAYTLQEMLTVKSDDVVGRSRAYEAILKGEDIRQVGVPEACKVLFMELRSLGFAIELLNEDEKTVNLFSDVRAKIETRF